MIPGVRESDAGRNSKNLAGLVSVIETNSPICTNEFKGNGSVLVDQIAGIQ